MIFFLLGLRDGGVSNIKCNVFFKSVTVKKLKKHFTYLKKKGKKGKLLFKKKYWKIYELHDIKFVSKNTVQLKSKIKGHTLKLS